MIKNYNSMKDKNLFVKGFTKHYLSIFIIVITGLTNFSCGSGELSRSEAQSLIENTKDFKQPWTLNLMTNTEKNQYPHATIYKKSAIETFEQASKRDLDEFLQFYSDIGVAYHLGAIKIDQTFKSEEPPSPPVTTSASFKYLLKVRTSDKGKAYWDEIEIPENGEIDKETNLPLAHKEFVQVTGITKDGENRAIAEYTYRWVPNQLGKHFDLSKEEFMKMPEKVKYNLQHGNSGGQDKSINWDGEVKQVALFQKFDDGWRIVSGIF